MRIYFAAALIVCAASPALGQGVVKLPAARSAAQAPAQPKASASPPQAAAAAVGICAKISEAIEGSEKELARLDAEDIGDNSAPRATLHAAKMNVELGLISANLAQLSAHHCVPYPHVIRSTDFMLGAMSCKTAMLRLQSAVMRDSQTKVESPAECDASKWTRLTEPKP